MAAASTIVVAGGEPGPLAFLHTLDLAGAFLVAVDRGLAVIAELGLVPDLFVGDGDSAPPELLAGLKPDRTMVITLPSHKDVSDLEATFEELIRQRRTDSVLVLAGLGGRLDHLLFNLQLAARYLPQFREITFEDDRCVARPLAQDIVLHLRVGMTVSFVPCSPQVRVSLDGFAYPLTHALIQQGSTRLLSNVVREPVQRAGIDEGTVLMIAWKRQVETSTVR